MRISDWSSDVCSSDLDGERDQVLLGVTGSGKTFTMAKVIDELQRPALILAPNKILAAQFYGEFKSFFRSDEHTSELQSLIRISYAVFCLKQQQYEIYINPFYTDQKNIHNQKSS